MCFKYLIDSRNQTVQEPVLIKAMFIICMEDYNLIDYFYSKLEMCLLFGWCCYSNGLINHT